MPWKKLLLLLGAMTLVSGLTLQSSDAAPCQDTTFCSQQDAICRANCNGLSGSAYSTCIGNCIKAYQRCVWSC